MKVKDTKNLPDVGTKFLRKSALEKCREALGLIRTGTFGTRVAAVLTTLESVYMYVRSCPDGTRHWNQSAGPTIARSLRCDDLHDLIDSNHHVEDHVHDRWHCGGWHGFSCDQEVRDESRFLASEAMTGSATSMFHTVMDCEKRREIW